MTRRILTTALLLALSAGAAAQSLPAPDAPPPPAMAPSPPPPPPPLCAQPAHGDTGDKGDQRPMHQAPSLKQLQQRLHIDAAKAAQVRKLLAERMQKQRALDHETCARLRAVIGAAALKQVSAPPPPPQPPHPPAAPPRGPGDCNG